MRLRTRSLAGHLGYLLVAKAESAPTGRQEEVIWPWRAPPEMMSGGLDQLRGRLFLWTTFC
jgi:hypothetical protein